MTSSTRENKRKNQFGKDILGDFNYTMYCEGSGRLGPDCRVGSQNRAITEYSTIMALISMQQKCSRVKTDGNGTTTARLLQSVPLYRPSYPN